MKSIVFFFSLLVAFFSVTAQQVMLETAEEVIEETVQKTAVESVFSENEFIKFKIKYLSFNTSTATLKVKKETLNGKPVFHIAGAGKSSGFLSLFFKIEDYYETYIDTETFKPYRFIRKINEGGHTKDIVIDFDRTKNEATVNDNKHKTKKTFKTSDDIQDMVSSFYYLRNTLKVDELKVGDEKSLKMFFDEENFNFKLKYLGTDTVRTKFGKISCLKFRPLVMADRVFKEEESLSIWVSNDKNLMPVKISADLAVGSLTAIINEYGGLKYPLEKVN